MTLDPVVSWILHEITVRPCYYNDLAGKALSEKIVDSWKDLALIVHFMIDDGLIHIRDGRVISRMVPYEELRTDIRDTELVLQSAIRKGGLTVRQVNRCEALLRAIGQFFVDEGEEATT